MEGLVEGQEERHGVGRPRLVYLLTDDGMEHFPTRYMKLTTRLLSQMKETMPGPVVAKLFNQIAEELSRRSTIPLGTKTDEISDWQCCQMTSLAPVFN